MRSSSMLGRTWLYRSNVIPIVKWSNASDTILVGMPAISPRVAKALAESLDKSFPWNVGFPFVNVEPILELWNIISDISGFDD